MDKFLPPEDMARLLDEDSGFRQYLNSIPQNDRGSLNDLLRDPSLISSLLEMLPPHLRLQTKELVDSLVSVPEKALALFNECRFLEARELLRRSLDLYRHAPGSPSEPLNKAVAFVTTRAKALFHQLLGDVEKTLGNSAAARDHYEKSLENAREIDDPNTLGKAFLGLAGCHSHFGDLEQATTCAHKALDYLAQGKDQWRMRKNAFNTLGNLYAEIGKPNEAIGYAQKAVDLAEELGDPQTQAYSLVNLACIVLEAGEPVFCREALEKACEIARAAAHPEIEAWTLNNLAAFLLKTSPGKEDLVQISSCLEQALAKSEAIGASGVRALTLRNKGALHKASGRNDEARRSYLEAVKIYRKTGARSEEAGALSELGYHLMYNMCDQAGAFQCFSSAVEIVEAMRGGMKKETHRISYAETITHLYDMMVDLLLEMGESEKALEYLERAKSRALLELLSERLMDRAVISSDSEASCRALKLLAEIEEIRKTIEAVEEIGEGDQKGVRENSTRGGADTPESLLRDLSEKERAFENAFSLLKETGLDTASLVKVVPLATTEIRDMLDSETQLLALYQGEKRLHLFLVHQSGEILARTLPLSAAEGADMVWQIFSALRRRESLSVKSHEFIREVRQPLRALFDLLIAPLRPWIDSCRRLLITPHLFWHYLPFHALYDHESRSYLCDRFETAYCPSASALKIAKGKERLGRDNALILVHHNGDLPYAEKEADLISRAFHPNASVHLGEDAHMEKIRERGAQDVIHLACHGHFDHDQPFLSGLDIPVDRGGARRTYLLDLFNLRLESALVTLSACDSGLTRFTRADELIGLSRGLFYAGASSLLLSLWQVSDESTCYLMENFYWHYTKNGQTKSRALQLAMQAVKARPEYAHPYYWAPFVIMGDWR